MSIGLQITRQGPSRPTLSSIAPLRWSPRAIYRQFSQLPCAI